MLLAERVAIVTGASRGLGRAIALTLAGQGIDIVVGARTDPLPGTIQETAAMVEGLGRRALPIEMNVTDEGDVKAMVARTIETFGRIDILVNNAGTNWDRNVVDFESKRWDLLLKVNAYGPFLCCKYALPHMIRQRGGHVLNISSIAAVRPHVGSSAYSASKAALEALTVALSQEVYEHGVCVNALRVEGTVDTAGVKTVTRFASRPLWPPEVIGEAVLYVTSQPFPYTGKVTSVGALRSAVPRIEQMLSRFDGTSNPAARG